MADPGIKPKLVVVIACAALLTTSSAAAVTGPLHDLPAGDDGGFHVVRFEGVISDDAHPMVEARGARIVGYQPRNAYVVWASASDVPGLRSLDGVAAVYPPDASRKIHPAVAERRPSAVAAVDVTFYRAVGAAVLPRIADIAGSVPVPHVADAMLETRTLTLASADVERLAEDPAVLFVGPAGDGPVFTDELSAQIVAGGRGEDGRVRPGYRSWLAGTGLDGTGVRVAVVDSGVSRYHPDLEGRVEPAPTAFEALREADTEGHGTHVAGIIGGAPKPDLDPSDPDGFLYGQGIAPAVRIVASRPEDDYHRLSSAASRAGAQMWNASWGTGEGHRVGYLASARAMDIIARDADLETPGNQDFLMVFAAGNEPSAGPIAPSEAKNIVAVGSTPNGRLVTWPLTQETEVVSSFSARGPTLDGRIFPTVVAPGGSIVSARAPEGSPPCVVPPDSRGLHASCGGTSMATPHVTGAAALVHQQWLERDGTTPSPAMVRALLVNSAKDLGDADIPNNEEGWGRLDMAALIADEPRKHQDQTVRLRHIGDDWTTTVSSDGSPLRVTLAWTDAPALPGASPTLVNDLDLIVEHLAADGTASNVWYGNVHEAGRSIPGGGADRLHTVEDVLLPSPVIGEYRIRVVAANLPGDGVPGNADPTDQDFALVIRGGSPAG
jgi:subtilisin family serine protease